MKNRNIGIVAAIVVALVIVAALIWAFTNNTVNRPKPQQTGGPVIIEGTITSLDASARVITIQQNGSIYPVALDGNTAIYTESGTMEDFTYLRKGFDASVEGIASGNNTAIASLIRVTRAPAIIIYSPKEEEVISDPTITVTGIARVFENQFTIRVRTSSTSVLFEEPVMTQDGEMGKFGNFNYTFTLSKQNVPNGRIFIDAFEYSAKDGSITNLATVPVTIAHQQTTTVKVYFNNDRLDPEMSCDKVFEIQRVIPYTQSVGVAALNELLTGPIQKEPGLGYYTNIPPETKLNSLRIENKVAYADFNATLDPKGGSCRVNAIRAQITQTLKQFPTVSTVVISINGNSADILQP